MSSPSEKSRLIGGRYLLEKLIGEGGTGEVWRARHVTLNSFVAIKFLHGASAFKENTRRRFLNEARLTAQLNTRHAVHVFDFGVTDQGRPYLIMEMLDGETLARRIARSRQLTPSAVVRIMRLAAKALDRAHDMGIVHRDFKPENIYLVNEDEADDVKVMDFGVAKLIGSLEEGSEEADEDPPARTSYHSFTRTGRSVGTPAYMAPEQTRAGTVGPTTDIWAMGVVAFECLTGYRPFRGKTVLELFTNITSGNRVLARSIRRDIPSAFDDWCSIACAVDPARRFPNASTAAAALADALEVTAVKVDPNESGRSLVPTTNSMWKWWPAVSATKDDAAPRRRRRLIRAAVAAGAVATAAGAILLIVPGLSSLEPARARELPRAAAHARGSVIVDSPSPSAASSSAASATSVASDVSVASTSAWRAPVARRAPAPGAAPTLTGEPKASDSPPAAPPVTAASNPSPFDLPELGL